MKNTIAVPLALMALLTAGCQRGGAASPTGTANTGKPTSTSTEVAPKNLVTPETAGKPVLTLKLGEPVVFRKGGITLTITAKSLEKLDGDPPDKSDVIAGKDCGVWWKLSDEVVVDAQPNATWKSWAVDMGVFYGLQESARGAEYDSVPVADSGTGPDRFINLAFPAEAEREKNPGVPFHKVLDSKTYYGMCKDSVSGEPSGLEPLGVDIEISNIPQGTVKPTTIARWLR